MQQRLKSADDKAAALKARMEKQRQLGATIDQIIREADAEPSAGCGLGICAVWRRLTRKQQSVAIASAVEASASTATSSSTASAVQQSSRLFGIKRANPHAKLAEAAASMEQRNQQLESRAASEREEAKRLLGLGQKSSALRALKKAKMTEKQLEANAAALMAVEQQVDLMAQAQMQKEVASALASSSKGMRAQKQLLKNAESAVDDASEARDMADDLSGVMTEFAQNGNGNEDDDDLMEELQAMVDAEPPRPPAAQLQDVALDSDGRGMSALAVEAAKAEEAAALEKRHSQWDEAEVVRQSMPKAPNGAGRAREEKTKLLSAGA